MNKARESLHAKMLAITLIPILLLGIIITMFSVRTFKNGIYEEVKEGLQSVCVAIVDLYENEYPGDYQMTMDGEEIVFVKGDRELNHLLTTLDAIYAATGMDITIFYNNVRVLTTVRDESGSRITGTKASAQVERDILQHKQEKFYDRAEVGEVEYFAYYMPLFNEDECVGMLFVGKPADSVEAVTSKAVNMIICIALVIMVVTAYFSIRFTNGIIAVLDKIIKFWGGLAIGNLSADLDESVVARRDEIGHMGRMTQHVQRSLRFMVEYDALTKMYNRRTIELRFGQMLVNAQDKGKPLSVVIADIDFFKKVNDTYGHECGDIVLREAAEIMSRHMEDKGSAGRWGGEEFLLVYEDADRHQAAAHLEELFEEIRKHAVVYEENTIHITMTAGVAEYNAANNNTKLALLREADNKLYVGKTSGRNQYVI